MLRNVLSKLRNGWQKLKTVGHLSDVTNTEVPYNNHVLTSVLDAPPFFCAPGTRLQK